MTLEEIARHLECRILCRNEIFSTLDVEHIIAGDLMSEVLVTENEHVLLITSLNTEQTIRTAHIVDAAGILLVNGKTPQPVMAKLAEEFELALLTTARPMFESCASLAAAIRN